MNSLQCSFPCREVHIFDLGKLEEGAISKNEVTTSLLWWWNGGNGKYQSESGLFPCSPLIVFFAVALTFEDLLFMSPFRLQISVNFVFRFIYHYRYYKFQRNYVPLSLIYNKILPQQIFIMKSSGDPT